MFRIGEFARLGQVSIKTLRHYDAIGLLRPASIDETSGYRFYEAKQLSDLARILALKDCGFALDEIAELLRLHDPSEIKELLQQRIAQQQQRIAEEQVRLQRIVARFHQLEQPDNEHISDVVLKRAEPITILGRRQTLDSTRQIGDFAKAVVEELKQGGIWPVGTLIHLYFASEEDEECPGTSAQMLVDVFVGTPVTGLLTGETSFTCMRLPGDCLLACILYRGDYSGILRGYVTLERWLEVSGYRVIGPYREIYHSHPLHSADPTTYVTEIQCPVSLVAPERSVACGPI